MNPSSSDVNLIVEQYRLSAGMLAAFFKHSPDRCYGQDGTGCCGVVSRSLVDMDVSGPAAPQLLQLRKARLVDPDREISPPCAYHLPGRGCNLGDLKPPSCLAHVCNANLPPDYDAGAIHRVLETILEGGFDPETGTYHPEDNWELVGGFLMYVNNRLGREVFFGNATVRGAHLFVEAI